LFIISGSIENKDIKNSDEFGIINGELWKTKSTTKIKGGIHGVNHYLCRRDHYQQWRHGRDIHTHTLLPHDLSLL